MVPTAICFISKDPSSGEDYEEGALIRELLIVDKGFWIGNESLYKETEKLVSSILDFVKIESSKNEDTYEIDIDYDTVIENINCGLKRFKSAKPSASRHRS